jgi:hypothetical protein
MFLHKCYYSHFSYTRIQCDNSIEGDCEATEAAREAFSFILDPLEAALRAALDQKIDPNEDYPGPLLTDEPDQCLFLFCLIFDQSKSTETILF